MLTIKSQESTNIKGGALVTETFFFVTDEQGQLVGRKAHSTEAEAQTELATLAGYASGLEFARAQFPGLGDKAHVGKANVVAEYLAWVEAGKPVKEAKADSADAEAPAEPEAEEGF